VYVENKALEETKFLIVLSYVNFVYAAKVYAFCLRTSKDSSMGEFDKSIISVFKCLFYLDFMCFYSLSRALLLQLCLVIFRRSRLFD
jgi:hypothetical protein